MNKGVYRWAVEIFRQKVKNKRFYALLSAALCMLLLFIAITMYGNKSDIDLPHAVGNVSVKYVKSAPSISTNGSIEWLTEEELFHKYDSDILKGKIEDVKNIKINLNGQIDYHAIVKIRVDKVYRGSEDVGNTICVLLRSPINSGLGAEDSEVVSEAKVGMNGIFMVSKYDENSCWESNGSKLYKRDIAEFYFRDERRYAFLEGQTGLIFSSESHPSVAAATSLQEIEQYVIKMIK